MTLFNLPRDTDEIFNQFFKVYPPKRRGTVRLAYAAWKQAIKREEPEVILAGAIAYAASDPGVYSKGTAAWLNGDQWAIDWTPAEKRPDKAVMKARFFDLRTRYKKSYHDFMTSEELETYRKLEKEMAG